MTRTGLPTDPPTEPPVNPTTDLSTCLTTDDVARLAARSGLPLADSRLPDVTATVNAIHQVVNTLRGIRFGETTPAPAFDASQG
ncbi:hypothetical protein OH807_01600 [Kitasatospora sp. NBC_01560]|uniref:hypothetical protein n=1 Tax=Kitasatospora sp. NBC_01560 TaxID=2975965 RepID=UPI003863062C